MYWTLELASHLEDAPWPATKDELIDYGIRSGAPVEVIENLQDLEDDGEPYENIEEIWPDYPTKDDFFFNEDSINKKCLTIICKAFFISINPFHHMRVLAIMMTYLKVYVCSYY